MAKLDLSSKRLQINKANFFIVAVTAAAVFVTIFSLVASYSLLGQRSYQAKVIAKKEQAKKQLDDNVKAADGLVKAYQTFVSTPTNALGGNSAGSGDRDGDNARIILDALPSKYDFPALATSLEKLALERNYKIVSITGTDEELTRSAETDDPNPKAIEIPFAMNVDANFAAMESLIGVFERSIRPFKVQTLTLTEKGSEVTMGIKAVTYYQPEKSLSIKQEVVK